MFCAHILLLSCLGASITSVTDPATPASPGFAATLQLGAGLLAEDPAALVQPRLSFAGDHGEVTLSAPLWLRLVDRSLSADGTEVSTRAPAFESRLHDPQTYLGFLERLTLSTPGHAVGVEAGTLPLETLGHGVLVDRYQSTLDPLRPRTGARLDVEAGGVSSSLLADSFIRTHLIAGSVGVAPLLWAGVDPEGRFQVRLDGAVDPLAPTLLSYTPTGGGALDVAYVLVSGESLSFEVYGAASAAD